jgi:ferritin
MSRKQTLISTTLSDLLVNQLAHELKNYNLYKTFANYFDVEGLVSLSEYYTKRAEEELKHHQWIYDYLTEADIIFQYPAIEANGYKVKNYVEPFQLTVDREIETTDLIYKIYETALTEKDYMTATWLQQLLIPEQIEEENITRMALTIMEEDADLYVRSEQILELLEK